MRMGFRNPWVAAAALTSALTASTASALPKVYVQVAPPAPIAEVRVVAPGPKHVWVAGYHHWDGRAYVWMPGRWVLPPRAGVVWVSGHWKHGPHGWFWVEGHWR